MGCCCCCGDDDDDDGIKCYKGCNDESCLDIGCHNCKNAIFCCLCPLKHVCYGCSHCGLCCKKRHNFSADQHIRDVELQHRDKCFGNSHVLGAICLPFTSLCCLLGVPGCVSVYAGSVVCCSVGGCCKVTQCVGKCACCAGKCGCCAGKCAGKCVCCAGEGACCLACCAGEGACCVACCAGEGACCAACCAGKCACCAGCCACCAAGGPCCPSCCAPICCSSCCLPVTAVVTVQPL